MTFSFLDLIFPPRCVSCRAHVAHGAALCADCRRCIVLHRTAFCGQCHARLFSGRLLCHRDFPYALAAAGEYTDPTLQGLIRSLKFHYVRSAAMTLGELLAAYAVRARHTLPGSLVHTYSPVGSIVAGYDHIVPIPLSARRRRERGFNQAELIARAFAARLHLPPDMVASGLLRRARHAPPQSGIHGAARRAENIAGCFEVPAPAGAHAPAPSVAGKNIILLDDVVTSGATMREAALALRAAGAAKILALAVAKA